MIISVASRHLWFTKDTNSSAVTFSATGLVSFCRGESSRQPRIIHAPTRSAIWPTTRFFTENRVRKFVKWPPRATTPANRPQVLYIPKEPYRRPFQPRSRFLERDNFWCRNDHFCEIETPFRTAFLRPGKNSVLLFERYLVFGAKNRKCVRTLLDYEFLRSFW